METEQTEQKEHNLLLASADKVLFRKQVRRELDETRREAEEVYALDKEIAPIPDSVYDDAYWLLKLLFDHKIPMPDIGWLMDGGIGFEWRSRDGRGIATMSMYGDNQVIYGASLGSTCKVKGTCLLTDSVLLAGFLPTLRVLCSS